MARPPFVAQYLPKLLAEGLTNAEIHAVFKGQGFAIGERRLGRLIGETKDLLARREDIQALPLNQKIDPTEVGTATRPRARGPLVNVEIAVYDPSIGEVGYHTWGVRSREWMSPAWYIQKAIDDWVATGQRGRGTPEGTPLGGVIGSAVELVGPDEEIEA